MSRRQAYRPNTNAQRRARALEGIHAERLSANAGHMRERITQPMTLLPVLVEAIGDELHAKRTGEVRSDPPLRKTRLDRELDKDPTGKLRWALSRYVCDVLLTQETPQAGEGGHGHPCSRVPFSEAQRGALRRLAVVHARCTSLVCADLYQFAVMLGARHPVIEPISLNQFGVHNAVWLGWQLSGIYASLDK